MPTQISIYKHKSYLQYEFDIDTIIKCDKLTCNAWHDRYEWPNDLVAMSKRTPQHVTYDSAQWWVLLKLFLRTPKDTPLKFYLYQMLVLNDIIIDGLNNKPQCPEYPHYCDNVRRLGGDRVNVCNNMYICMRLPVFSTESWGGFRLDFPANQDYVLLDDRILQQDAHFEHLRQMNIEKNTLPF